MDSIIDTSDTRDKLAALKMLFAAVAATAVLPGTAQAFAPPPPLEQLCGLGTWSSTGRTPCQTATLGHFVDTAGATSQKTAPLGTYVDTTGASAAKPAPLGRYVDTTGASAAKLAPLGSYVDTIGASAAKLAPLGSYVDTAGASAAKLAPLGRYVDTTGATAAKLAPLGSYVDTTGASAAKLAPLGRYVDTTGATAAKPAPLGSYVDTTGASSAKPAPMGSYVDTVGASAAKLAPPGSYVDTVGASAAKLAPAGYYVALTGQSAPQAAPPGTYAAGLGSAAAAVCPTGSNAYGAGSACRIIQEGFHGSGVTPLLGSTFGTGGTHDLGALLPGDSFVFKITNTSADIATPGNLTALTLLSYSFSDANLFDLEGFTSGMPLAAGGGFASLSLHAKAGLPTGAFSFSLTLNTDQYANYQTAGKQFSYNFTGFNATPVPEPGPTALLLTGLGALALWQRRRSAPVSTASSRRLAPGHGETRSA